MDIRPAIHYLGPIENRDTIQYHSKTLVSIEGVELFGDIVETIKNQPRKMHQVWVDPRTMLTLNAHDGVLSVWSGRLVSTQVLDLFVEDGQYMWDKILTYTAQFIAQVKVLEVMES
jgi:hypothetical protein